MCAITRSGFAVLLYEASCESCLYVKRERRTSLLRDGEDGSPNPAFDDGMLRLSVVAC
jgi:hypothetical protein